MSSITQGLSQCNIRTVEGWGRNKACNLISLLPQSSHESHSRTRQAVPTSELKFSSGCSIKIRSSERRAVFRASRLMQRGHYRMPRQTHAVSSGEESASADDGQSESSEEASGVPVNVEVIGLNTRRVSASIQVAASLEVVWRVLTDYPNLSDFIPSLAVNEVLERRPNGARLLQIGEQDLALGAKFRAKAVVDVEEIPAEKTKEGAVSRDIVFTMVEGDFQSFKGTWRMIESEAKVTELSYSLEVKPQVWLPVALVEGRIKREIGSNLLCVRDKAVRTAQVVA